MAKDELFHKPVLGWVVKKLGAFLEFAALHSLASGVVNYICIEKYTHNKTTR